MTAPEAKTGSLVVLCATQFVLVLDVAVVDVAIVPLADDLALDLGGVQLVASVYVATFGGGLLLGGRLADHGRRRRMFLIGLGIFAAASVLCGLAPSVALLVAGRAVQGIGAAIASPAALSLLTTIFDTPPAGRGRSASGRRWPRPAVRPGCSSGGGRGRRVGGDRAGAGADLE